MVVVNEDTHLAKEVSRWVMGRLGKRSSLFILLTIPSCSHNKNKFGSLGLKARNSRAQGVPLGILNPPSPSAEGAKQI